MRLLTGEQLAKELSLRPATIKRWGQLGKIPRVVVSRRVVRYDLEDVVAVLKRNGGENYSESTSVGETMAVDAVDVVDPWGSVP